MRLIECYVEGFGKIKNRHIDFSEGLNCILEDNGAGKTTLAAFIKVMLYGMSDTKKASLEENDRKHYLPWDGGAARGTLTFRTGGREYRIERSFAQKAADDTFILYDTSTGKVTEDLSERLGEELFGIDADGFERTVFLSERALTPRSENKSISAKLSDLVGCDGDIGVMDEAVKRLEEERKFYYKKGGAGELSNIKGRVLEARARLDRLAEAEALCENAEKRHSEIKSELSELYKAREALSKEREERAHAEARANMARRYEELKSEISRLAEKRAELIEFFGGTPPTGDEINEAYLKAAEAKRLESAAMDSGESREFAELSEYFKDTHEDEMGALRSALYEIKRKQSAKESPEAKGLLARFSKRIPKHTELDELILLARRPKVGARKTPRGVFIAAGVLLSVLGTALGVLLHPMLLALLLPGIICLALPFIGKRIAKDECGDLKFREFYDSISDAPFPGEDMLLSDLIEIKASIDRAEALISDSKPGDAEAVLSDLAKKFGFAVGDAEFAEGILKKYDRFSALAGAESYKREERRKNLDRAEALRREADIFIERFPVKSDDAFGELRERRGRLEEILANIGAKEREARKFAEECDADALTRSAPRSAEQIECDRRATEEKITECEREAALTERQAAEYARELEDRDELVIKLKDLEQSLEKNTENYEVILKTKVFLEKAKDSMTAKYLGKTKAGFERYTALMGGVDDGRFEMSTDFGVSKFEGASPKSTEAYSRGTKDLYNLAARLALVDSLYEKEEPFIILDDPFVSFDDGKTAAALELLARLGERRQIIYFTCSKSRSV